MADEINLFDPTATNVAKWNHWVNDYYDEYTKLMNAAGLETVDMDTWGETYFKNKWNSDAFEDNAVKWRQPAAEKMTELYNDYAQDIAKATGGQFIPYDGSTNVNDIYSSLSRIKSSHEFEMGQGYDRYAADAKKQGITPVERDQWKPNTVIEQPEYNFEMPEEWQTIEDMANKRVAGGEPSLSPESITGFENKLESAYAPVRENLKESMADYWASLFPQGGGSGTQAKMNMDQLNNFELDKFNRALDMANTDLATKLALYNQAQTQLSDIGQFKAAADQFKSQQDAANYWSTISTKWDQSKYFNDILQAQKSWNQESELAKYLAQIQQQKSNPWDQALTAFAGGVGQSIPKLFMPTPK